MADTDQPNTFVDQLLKDLRLEHLPEPKRSEVLNKIAGLVEKRVLQTVLGNMDDESLKEFEQKLKDGMAEEQAAQFMIEKVPGLSAKVEQVLADLHNRLVADASQVDQSLGTALGTPLVTPQETPSPPPPP